MYVHDTFPEVATAYLVHSLLRCHKIVDKRLGQMPVTERGYYQSHSEIQTLDGASASIKRRIKTEALYIGACIFQCQ